MFKGIYDREEIYKLGHKTVISVSVYCEVTLAGDKSRREWEKKINKYYYDKPIYLYFILLI